MATLTPSAKQQFFDANGNPLSGGKLYTYAAGTTTPLATYTDSSGTTPNANPVILDSRGEANLWLGSAVYKFKLTTSTDVEVWTVDNISTDNYEVFQDLAASGGSNLVGFIQSGSGATARTVQSKLRDAISVKDFGAVGDGTTDDTAAFQAALVYGTSAFADVIIPDAKTYKLTAGITVDLAKTALIGNGAVLDFTTLTSGKAITFSASEGYPALAIGARESGGFVVKGGNYAAATGIYIAGSISAQFTRQVLLKNISVYRFGKNYEYGNYVYRIKFEHCSSSEANTYHVYSPAGLLNFGEVMVWSNCLFENGTNSSLYLRDGQFFFENCSFLNCTIDTAADNHTILFGGNIEAPGYTGTGYRYVTLSDYAYVELKGTQITIADPGTTLTQAQFYCAVSEGGGLVFDGCRIPMSSYQSPQTSDSVKTFVAGNGRVQLKGAHLYNSFGTRDFFPIAKSCNVIYNGDAETGNTNGWVTAAIAGSGALTASAGAKKNGTYGFQISTVSALDVFEASQTFSVTPGRVVLCSMWYQNTTAKASRVRLEGYTTNGTLTLYANKILDGNGTWYNDIGTISRIVPAGTVTCKLIVQSYDQSITYFDDVIVNVI